MVPRLLRGAAAAGCLLIAATALAQPSFVPNHIKYKESGIKPATGRSGSATIEARALLGKDNLTAIEVSTPAPGVIERVQVKRAGADEATNFNGLDGNTFRAAISGPVMNERIQIQANVSGIDGARMDVVTVETTVGRRPDLSVTGITAAPHAVAGGPVRIAAVIRELNGDTGARASCVLSVAGMDVDRADDIWVDAGDSVSCIFSTPFPTAGEKHFTVRVENIRPGDDDSANDSAGGSMRVYATANEFTLASVSVRESHYTSQTNVTAWWGASQDVEQGVDSDSVIYTYIADQNVDLSNLVISSRETTEGELIHESNGVELSVTPGQWYGEPTCASAWKDFQLYIMCDIPLAEHQPRSFWMEVWRMASAVTYHSTGWNRTIPSELPPGYYTWNQSGGYHYGSQTRLRSTYEWQLTISNGLKLWETSGVLPITTSTNTYGSSRYCFSSGNGQQCVDTLRTSIDKRGSAVDFGGD